MCSMVVVIMRVSVLDNRITRGAYMGHLWWQVDFAIFVIVSVVCAFWNGGERLASLDQICNDGSMGPDAAAARPLGVAFHFAFAALAASLITLERNNRLLSVSMDMGYT